MSININWKYQCTTKNIEYILSWLHISLYRLNQLHFHMKILISEADILLSVKSVSVMNVESRPLDLNIFKGGIKNSRWIHSKVALKILDKHIQNLGQTYSRHWRIIAIPHSNQQKGTRHNCIRATPLPTFFCHSLFFKVNIVYSSLHRSLQNIISANQILRKLLGALNSLITSSEMIKMLLSSILKFDTIMSWNASELHSEF